jgi:membrane-bound serine protease (ClpP class)
MRRFGVWCILLACVLSAWSLGLSLAALAEAPDAGTEAAEEKAGEAYNPRPSQQGKTARTVKIGAKEGQVVVRVPIEGTIDLGLAAFMRRVLEQHQDAAAILLDVNTLGGRVDAAIQIRDALLASKVKTIAFIHPRAISAGALISLACDVIAVSKGASIGAATPIEMDGGEAKAVGEKMVSYFRTEMRTTAEAKGRRGDIAEAMVDRSVVIKGIDDGQKLLTLDSEAALEYGMADFLADDTDKVLAQVGLPGRPVKDMAENWAEKLVRFLTDPIVSGLLMSLGTLGILIELYTPGLGIPGAVGVLCLCLFFGGHLLVNLAGLEELLLFTAGLVLLAVEVFVLPGFGVAGIAGVVCVFAALLLTLIGLPLDVAFTTGAWTEPLTRVLGALVVTVLLMLVALRFLPKTSSGRGLILSTATASSDGFVSAVEPSRLLRAEGVAETDLRPVGVARIAGERVDVVSEGPLIARGARVQVVEVEGSRVVVRELSQQTIA